MGLVRFPHSLHDDGGTGADGGLGGTEVEDSREEGGAVTLLPRPEGLPGAGAIKLVAAQTGPIYFSAIDIQTRQARREGERVPEV